MSEFWFRLFHDNPADWVVIATMSVMWLVIYLARPKNSKGGQNEAQRGTQETTGKT